MIEKDDPRLRFISLDKVASAPSGLVWNYTNRFWAVCPERGVMFWKPKKRWPGFGAPQCNSEESIAKSIQEKLYPWAEVKFLPSVFIKASPDEFRD